MKQHFSQKELSAYFDGESEYVYEIQRHLDECADCRTVMQSFEGVSNRIHTWEAPEVHPAFATRVLGDIGSELPRKPFGLAIRFGIAAFAVLTVGMFTFLNTGSDTNVLVDTPVASAVSNDPLFNVAKSLFSEKSADESSLVAGDFQAELQRRFAVGDTLPTEAGFGMSMVKETSALNSPNFMLSLMDEQVAETVEEQWLSTPDSTIALGRLNGAEAQLFKQLLAHSAQKTILGQHI